jgi:DNA invertase Pin-like site-specific DNA recombinase
MRAFPYLRVSGKTQVDGDGPDRQSEKISAFCQRHGIEMGAVYFDAGVSGTVDSLDRPMLAKLLDDSRPGDAIVVERMDRLARDLIVQEVLLAECRKRQLKVFSVDTGDTKDVASNDGDPTLVLIRQILGAVAQWEKSVLVMKMKAGADRKRRETGRCGGVVPYGQGDSSEKDFLGLMLLMWEQKDSMSTIARNMNERGIRTRSGKEWTKQRVHNAIARHTGAKL